MRLIKQVFQIVKELQTANRETGFIASRGKSIPTILLFLTIYSAIIGVGLTASAYFTDNSHYFAKFMIATAVVAILLIAYLLVHFFKNNVARVIVWISFAICAGFSVVMPTISAADYGTVSLLYLLSIFAIWIAFAPFGYLTLTVSGLIASIAVGTVFWVALPSMAVEIVLILATITIIGAAVALKRNWDEYRIYKTVVEQKDNKQELSDKNSGLEEQKLLLERLHSKLENESQERKRLEERINVLKTQIASRDENAQTELEMARRIQKSLIPDAAPTNNIAFYFKPMEQVGGDFFDFISYFESELIGIFLCDISGHGVPAAFIASMIKNWVTQLAPLINNPAEFMEQLNENLALQTSGHYVTAFYGIYNPGTREFHYSNAGHNPPFILCNSSVGQLQCTGMGLPLAVMDNGDLGKFGKEYKNNCVVLERGTKLVLYTNGFSEAVNIYEKTDSTDAEDFETHSLASILRNTQYLPTTDFVRVLTKKLIEYRGKEEFDDDVCLICLDAD